MGREQFTSAVGGAGGAAIATSTQGTVETDNYAHGGAFDYGDGAGSINPAEVIQELIVTGCGGDAVVTVTTVGGDEFDVELRGATAVFDKWSIDSVTFSDPGNDRLTGAWAGE